MHSPCWLLLAAFGAAIAVLTGHASAEDSAAEDSAAPPAGGQKIAWSLPLAVAKDAPKEHVALAEALNDVLARPKWVWRVDGPNCCFYVEIVDFAPNPGGGGYLILIQPGGAVLRASDMAHARQAIARLKSLAQVEDGQVLLPVGLLSSYPIIGGPDIDAAAPEP